jgi:hypothetical protein
MLDMAKSPQDTDEKSLVSYDMIDNHISDLTSSGYCGSDADVICCLHLHTELEASSKGPFSFSPRKSKRVRCNNSPTALQKAENGYERKYADAKVRVRRVAVKAFAVRNKGASDRKVRVTVVPVAVCVCEIVNLVTSYDRSGPGYARKMLANRKSVASMRYSRDGKVIASSLINAHSGFILAWGPEP